MMKILTDRNMLIPTNYNYISKQTDPHQKLLKLGLTQF